MTLHRLQDSEEKHGSLRDSRIPLKPTGLDLTARIQGQLLMSAPTEAPHALHVEFPPRGVLTSALQCGISTTNTTTRMSTTLSYPIICTRRRLRPLDSLHRGNLRDMNHRPFVWKSYSR